MTADADGEERAARLGRRNFQRCCLSTLTADAPRHDRTARRLDGRLHDLLNLALPVDGALAALEQDETAVH